MFILLKVYLKWAVIIIDYLYATHFGTIRVEILFRAYKPNSNMTQSLNNYLLNHTTLII
jgi:hypothetical protein